MRSLAAIAALFLSIHANAAFVLWNEEAMECIKMTFPGEEPVMWSLYCMIDTPDLFVYKELWIDIATTGDGTFRNLYGVSLDTGTRGTYVVSEYGETMDANLAMNSTKVFYPKVSSGSVTNLLYRYDEPFSFYLGMEFFVSYTTAPYASCVYGWAELFVDNYTISLGNACLDLSGRPVIVGVRPEEPIPEPATGALALLGAAMLFRRHRRPWRDAEHNEARSA